jgi:hypothetical protein
MQPTRRWGARKFISHPPLSRQLGNSILTRKRTAKKQYTHPKCKSTIILHKNLCYDKCQWRYFSNSSSDHCTGTKSVKIFLVVHEKLI